MNRELPNKPEHVINSPDRCAESGRHSIRRFYGCYDWHSAVHGHWMLVSLLKTFPNLPGSKSRFGKHSTQISRRKIFAQKRAYMAQPNRQSFERTYGWAWLLKLAEEFTHGTIRMAIIGPRLYNRWLMSSRSRTRTSFRSKHTRSGPGFIPTPLLVWRSHWTMQKRWAARPT